MPASLTKVIYKANPQSTDEYTIIVDPDQYKKWKDGDTSIPLSSVVDSFKIFHSIQGSQGILRTPSQQQLDTDFGTHKDVDVVEHILKNGKEQSAEGIKSSTNSLNLSRSSASADTRGKSLSGI